MKSWKPKKGEKYFYVNGFCSVDTGYNWGYDYSDARMKVKNCFRTKEEAEVMAEKFKQLLKQEYKQTLEKIK